MEKKHWSLNWKGFVLIKQAKVISKWLFFIDYAKDHYTVKWREPNWPQKPNWLQCHEGQYGLSRFVLDYLSQNGSDRYHFDPSKIWIGPNEFYFGAFSQFGPTKIQVGFTNDVQFLKWLIIIPKLSSILVTWKSHHDLNDTKT